MAAEYQCWACEWGWSVEADQAGIFPSPEPLSGLWQPLHDVDEFRGNECEGISMTPNNKRKPFKPDSNRMIVLNLRIESEVAERVEAAAKRRRMRASEFYRQAIRYALDNMEATDDRDQPA